MSGLGGVGLSLLHIVCGFACSAFVRLLPLCGISSHSGFSQLRCLNVIPPGGRLRRVASCFFFFPELPENKLASKTLFIYFAIWTLEYNTASCGVSVISRPPEGSDVTGPLPLRWVLITVLEKLPPVNTVRLKLRPKLITGSPETVRQ